MDDELQEPQAEVVPEVVEKVPDPTQVKTLPPQKKKETLLTSTDFTMEGGILVFQFTVMPVETGHKIMVISTINNDFPNITSVECLSVQKDILAAQINELVQEQYDLLVSQLAERKFAATSGVVITGGTYKFDKTKIKPKPVVQSKKEEVSGPVQQGLF